MKSMKFVVALALTLGGAVVGLEQPAEANSPSSANCSGPQYNNCMQACRNSAADPQNCHANLCVRFCGQ